MITLLVLAMMLPSDPPAIARSAPSPGYPSAALDVGPPGSAFRYKYAEGALLLGDFDGVRGGGAWHISGPWVGLGRLDYLTEDEGSVDVDLFLLSGGVGYVHTIEPNLDFIGSAELEIGDAEIDGPGGSDDDDDLGLKLRAGARFQPADKVELAGGISFTTIFDEELGLDFQALYDFNENFAGFLGFDNRDDTVWMIGVRYYF